MSRGGRVLLAKIGLDGHDRGVRVIARTLRDAGHEVIYLGRRQSAEAVALAAIDEDVDVVGISILSGTHVQTAARVVGALGEAGANVPVVVGGTILRREIPGLLAAGVAAVFPVGTTLEEIRAYFDAVLRDRAGSAG
jgi:methylmalonyl-CoA mutase C-terminal domain/subunit